MVEYVVNRRNGAKWFIFCVFFILPSTSSKQYRLDYVYNRKTDAFYKFHMEALTNTRAREKCEIEGASLMMIKSDEDTSQAHGMFKQYPDIGDIAWVSSDGNKHDSAEETQRLDVDNSMPREIFNRLGRQPSECDVFKRNGEILAYSCYRSLPFICKVEANDVVEDTQCKVFGRGYKYYEGVGSCYKIPSIAYSWDEAYSECRAEGAHLAILNSEDEHNIIHNITDREMSIKGSQISYFYIVGIRAEKKTDGSPIVFKTIFNQTLDEAGYNQWTGTEPNNHGGNEYCGTIFKTDGKYNDLSCSQRCGFICEKEVTNV